MKRLLQSYSELVYALMRIVVGALFLCHGAQKLFGVLGGQSVIGKPLMVTAGMIELVAGGLIALGLFAGFAAFIASGQMAVAYFMAHAPNGFWPIMNRGELAVLYCFVFLFIAAKGSGTLSIDAIMGRKKAA